MRLRFMFWLDLDKDDELFLSNQIQKLKGERTFAKTIRDGLRLINDLRVGRTDVLRELFPWVMEQQESVALQPPLTPISTVEQIIAEYVSRLETLMQGQAGGMLPLASGVNPLKLGSGSAKPLSTREIRPPDEDDYGDLEALLETKTAQVDTTGGKNLLMQLLEATQTDFSTQKPPPKPSRRP